MAVAPPVTLSAAVKSRSTSFVAATTFPVPFTFTAKFVLLSIVVFRISATLATPLPWTKTPP